MYSIYICVSCRMITTYTILHLMYQDYSADPASFLSIAPLAEKVTS